MLLSVHVSGRPTFTACRSMSAKCGALAAGVSTSKLPGCGSGWATPESCSRATNAPSASATVLPRDGTLFREGERRQDAFEVKDERYRIRQFAGDEETLARPA